MPRVTPWTTMRVPCLLYWTLALLPTCPLAKAPIAVSLADMSLEELSNIDVVSASRRAESLSDAAAAVFLITADDIRRSGATTLPEALRLAPNLDVAQINNAGWSISARGFSGTSSTKLLVLIDGRSVYTPLFAGVFWDMQEVMMQDIERIEVVSGPGGTLWGVNAVNGVINVITKTAQETQGGLLATMASDHAGDITLRQGWSLGEDMDEDGAMRLYARHRNEHHTELADGSAVDDAGQVSLAGMRADWNRSHDRVMLEGQVYRGDHGQPRPGSIALIGRTFALRNIEIKGAHLTGHWDHRLDSGGQFSLQGYFDHTERGVPPFFAEKLDISDVQFHYAAPRSDRHAWILGGEYRLGQDRVDNSENFAFLPADLNQIWTSLYAQDEITLDPKLRLTLGARLETNDYTGVEWLPNARLAWKPAQEHLLWTALSRTVRAPSRFDRDPYLPYPALNQAHPPYLLAGGPDVDAEPARTAELGYRGQPSPSTSLSLTLYRSLYDNLHTQEARQQGGLPYVVFASGMRAAITGLEAWGSYQPLPAWRLSAGFAGLYQRFALSPDSTDASGLADAQGKDPAQIWQLRSSWDGPRGHEFDLTVRHVSALPHLSIPSYLALDLRWGWRPRTDLELALAARNILGSGHDEYTSISHPAYRSLRSEIGPAISLQAVMWF